MIFSVPSSVLTSTLINLTESGKPSEIVRVVIIILAPKLSKCRTIAFSVLWVPSATSACLSPNSFLISNDHEVFLIIGNTFLFLSYFTYLV